ncbi:MAG: 8-oxoguanine DNA glycosylase [Clostridia bacterium]|nr:8-oxoguanine DNA glycosylase [Clostridia bacterium]
MKLKEYCVIEENDKIIVENVHDFNPVHIFECGQCFRWVKQPDGSYIGVVRDRVVKVRYRSGMLEIHNSTSNDFLDIWYDYFDLGRDYSEIKGLIAKDEIMKKAVEFGSGIRLLRQDLWEMIISFILSSNNIIPRIIKIIDSISRTYGKKIDFEGKSYYTFPCIDGFMNSDLEKLEICRAGYRCKYIVKTLEMMEKTTVKISNFQELGLEAARKKLMEFPGVGPKVADCILLFSGIRFDVFPTDVWVKRVVEELYFGREVSFKEIQEFAKSYFGPLAGFAQQYLFFYAREKKIGVKK